MTPDEKARLDQLGRRIANAAPAPPPDPEVPPAPDPDAAWRHWDAEAQIAYGLRGGK